MEPKFDWRQIICRTMHRRGYDYRIANGHWNTEEIERRSYVFFPHSPISRRAWVQGWKHADMEWFEV